MAGLKNTLARAACLSALLTLGACDDSGAKTEQEAPQDGAKSTLAESANTEPAAPASAEDVKAALAPKAEEFAVGNPDAPVTIVEYASLTCGHCANFHNDVLPELKARFIETGEVYFIFRPFPLDPVAARASAIARCMGPDKGKEMIDVMYQSQPEWAGHGNPDQNLVTLAKNAGMTPEEVSACYATDSVRGWLDETFRTANTVLGVEATPTFFVNGKKYEGVQRIGDLEKAIRSAKDGAPS